MESAYWRTAIQNIVTRVGGARMLCNHAACMNACASAVFRSYKLKTNYQQKQTKPMVETKRYII